MSEEILVIKILDQEYKIKLGEQDPQHIKKLAKFINEKVKEFKQIFPDLNFEKLLLIVSINLADDIFKQEDAFATQENELMKKKLLSLKDILEENS